MAEHEGHDGGIEADHIVMVEDVLQTIYECKRGKESDHDPVGERVGAAEASARTLVDTVAEGWPYGLPQDAPRTTIRAATTFTTCLTERPVKPYRREAAEYSLLPSQPFPPERLPILTS